MILITEFMDEDAVECLRRDYDVRYDPDLAAAQERIPALAAGARALIVRNQTKVTAALLDAAPDLACVGRLGVSLDNIDLAVCEARGIAVYPATGANNLSVAEYVIGNAMLLLRSAYSVNAAILAGDWPRGVCGKGRELAGKMLGLVGYGAIARETAEKARALGMTIAAFDPYLPAGDPAWRGTRNLPFEALLAEADVVSLHVPLTEETRHLIDAERLALMKPDAILINAARGGVVDEAALAEALAAGRLGGAALDVFETEPLSREAAARFAGLSNLVLTPHIAGVTQESNVRVSAMTARAVADHLARH